MKKKIPLGKQIIKTFSLILMISSLPFSGLMYWFAETTIKENALSLSNLFVSQVSAQIDGYYERFERITYNLQADNEILYYLSNEENMDNYTKIEAHNRVNTSLQIIHNQMPEFLRILCVGSSGGFYSSVLYNDWLDKDILLEETWYQNIRQSPGSLQITAPHPQTYSNLKDPEMVVTFGKILKNVQNKTCGVLVFDMEPEKLLPLSQEQKETIDEYHYQIQIKSEGTILYQYPDNEFEKSVDCLEVVSPIGAENINVHFVVSEKDLYYKLTQTRTFIIMIFVVTQVIIICFSSLISRSITKPLKRLVSNMESVKEGKYSPVVYEGDADEIGSLTDCYNTMIRTIQKLINDVYISEIQKKNAQFEALRQQFHPHMLYNTLENIRMTAVINNDPEVAEMTQSLGKFFRLTLSNVETSHSIADELEYTRLYLDIINIRKRNNIKLECNIPEELLRKRIVSQVFQPIVENCVKHGFENMLGECMIRIYSEDTEQGLYIYIEDDGIGIEKETLDTIKAVLETQTEEMVLSEHRGLGLKNIFNRIRLEYGEEYGIDIQSEPLFGTTVILYIPS